MFISNDTPARFQVMLLEPITGKILYDETNHLQMTAQPVRCFTVETMSYLKFVAKAQTTSADTLAILAERRQELLDSMDDKKLLEQIINYVDYGIGQEYLLTTHNNVQHKREVFEQLCQLNVEVFKASRAVILKEVAKRVLLGSDDKPTKTVVTAVFVDHNGNELALHAFEVPHPVASPRPWQQPLPPNRMTQI